MAKLKISINDIVSKSNKMTRLYMTENLFVCFVIYTSYKCVIVEISASNGEMNGTVNTQNDVTYAGTQPQNGQLPPISEEFGGFALVLNGHSLVRN